MSPWNREVKGGLSPDPCRGGSMQLSGIPFGTTDWSMVETTEHKGETGVAYWRTRNFGGIRVRMVEYNAGYLADHWCTKGHILLCVDGELHTELAEGPELMMRLCLR